MNKSFTTMKTNVGNAVQDTSSEMLSKIGVYLNDRLQEVRRRLKHVLTSYSRNDYTLSVTAGTRDYALPDDLGEIVSAIDLTNNRQICGITYQDWVDKFSSALNTASTVQNYVLINSPVRTQPSTAGTITAVSSSSADTTQTLYIRGLDTNGREINESNTLSGTGTVTTTNSFSRVLSISKSASTTGTVTVSRGSDTLAYLSPEMLEHRIKVLRLVQTPVSGLSLLIVYIPVQLPLSNAYDFPIEDCGDALEAGATADAWRYKRMHAKAQDFEAIFEKRLANFAWDLESNVNRVPMFRPQAYSRNIV